MAQKQIFLSHRSSQKVWLKRHLVPSLEAVGLDVWLDERELRTLEPITDAVRQAIAKSHLFLAWWFDGYEESQHCHFELITALAHCRVEGQHSYQQRVFFAGPDAARLFPEAGIFRGLLAPQLSEKPNKKEIIDLVTRLKDRAMQIDVERPFGANQIEGPIGYAILPNPSFVGRSPELLQLLGHLAPTYSQKQTAQIVGFPGEGKTEVAAEFARRFSFLYPGGIFRIDLPGDTGDLSQTEFVLDSALRKFAEDLALIDKEVWASRGRLRDLLCEKLLRPYLWIVNDFPTRSRIDPNFFDNLVEDCMAPNNFGGCLISSRTEINRFPRVKINALLEKEGMLLLERLAPKKLTPEQKTRVHELVHGHALALSLIGHGVDRGLDIEEFLNTKGPIIKALDKFAIDANAEKDGYRSIRAILVISLSWIPKGSHARRILELMAHLAPAPIPRELLQRVFDRILSNANISEGISDLLKCGIISQQDVGRMTCLRLHPFMAEVVLADMDTREKRDDLLNIDEILQGELAEINKDVSYYQVNPLSPLLLPHAQHRVVKKLALDQGDTDFGALLARVLHLRGNFSGARALKQQVLEIRHRTLGPKHPDTIDAMISLATTLRVQDDRGRSLELQQQVVDIRRSTLGQEHLDTLAAMADLAYTLQLDGELTGALPLQRQVYEARRRILGLNDPRTLSSMSALASTYRGRLNFKAAKKIDTDVLKRRRRLLGNEHPDTLSSMINLASDQSALGELAHARALQEEALVVRSRTLGSEHPDTLNAAVHLAGTFVSLNEEARARQLVQRILPLLPTLTHADLRKALTDLARHLKLLPPEAP